MTTLKRSTDAAIFASALLGVLFLYEAAALVPKFLLESLAAGEVAYAACAIAVAAGLRPAYYAVFALAVLVLVVSLPQPGHYALATGGEIGDFMIFVAGSVLQGSLLVMIPVHLLKSHKK